MMLTKIIRVLGNGTENIATLSLNLLGTMKIDFERSNTSMKGELSNITFTKPYLPNVEEAIQIQCGTGRGTSWRLNIPVGEATEIMEYAERVKSSADYQLKKDLQEE